MAWHKQKEYDPTAAFLANNKQQQLLEIKINDIDKLWIARLKYYAKDRLETTAELMRLTADKRHSDHFDETLNPEKLKKYTEQIGRELKQSHKELTSDNFDFDKYKRRRNSIPVTGITTFPKIEKQNTEVNFKLKRESTITKSDLKGFNKSKKSSKASAKSVEASMSLKSSRFISVSDTDLYKQRKVSIPSANNQLLKRSNSDLEQRLKTDLYKKSKNLKNSRVDLESILRVADVNSPIVDKKPKRTQAKVNRKLPLLTPKKMVVTKNDHRYLKQHMETTVLPPLSEDNHKRKMSC